MKAAGIKRRLKAGEDVSEHVDWSQASRPDVQARRVNVDSLAWMVGALDREARRLGVTRQSLIKLWIVERLPQSGLHGGGGRRQFARPHWRTETG